MLYSNYELFFFDNFIERYAKLKGKPIIYLRSYGWNNSSNVDAINESMEFYKEILPDDMFYSLKNSEFVFVEVDDIYQAEEFLDDCLPKSQSDVASPEFYIHFSLYNELGQIILSN
jgi:hypothetical protein